MFSAPSMFEVNHMCGSLNSTKKGSLAAAQYLSKMKTFSFELTALSKPVDESELVNCILNSLDSSYNDVVTTMNGNPGTKLDDLMIRYVLVITDKI
jgi:hypothetical protein